MGQYVRSYTYSTGTDDAIMYESITGTLSVVAVPGTLRQLKKTIWQDDSTPTIALGDSFTAAGVSGICTKITVSDEADAIDGKNVLRRWRIDIEGIENAGSSLAGQFKREYSLSRKLNGSVEDSIDGETVILTRSATPKVTLKIVGYGATDNPTYDVGDAYSDGNISGGVVVGADVSLVTVERSGHKLATFYRYDIEIVQ